jgi:hypothetical protein
MAVGGISASGQTVTAGIAKVWARQQPSVVDVVKAMPRFDPKSPYVEDLVRLAHEVAEVCGTDVVHNPRTLDRGSNALSFPGSFTSLCSESRFRSILGCG